jgi:hypothetical protein
MLLGYAALIQPSVQLFPVALFAIGWLRGEALPRTAMRIAVLGLSMLTVIAPWTLRNYQIFGEVVLIGTNGGPTFYRANNPLATGGYTQQGEVSLDGLGEIEANRKGYELAKAWIRENPGDFLALAVKKQILFMGDDSTGMYATLKRGGLSVSDRSYVFAKAAANGFWLLLWVLVLLSMSDRLRRCTGAISVAAMPLLYFLALHSVFESSSKYHVPAIAFVLILAATAFQARWDAVSGDRQGPGCRNVGVHGG